MPLEVAQFVNQLDPNNPFGTDNFNTTDDHLRLIKRAVRDSFVNVAGVVTANHIELSYSFGLTSPIQGQLAAKQDSAQRGVANGYCDLDGAARVPNTRISLSSVQQYQNQLTIGWAQLTGVPGTFPPAAHNHDASALTSGSIPDARVPASNVTQHEASIGVDSPLGNRVVRRDASGHIYAVNFNQASINNENPLVSQVLVTNGSDNFARKASIAHVKRAVTLSCTIQADPGGTPSGSPGDVFFYY